MKTKTCGECRYLVTSKDYGACCTFICDAMCDDDRACYNFEPLTNGDVIRQGGNKAIVEFSWSDPCLKCFYSSGVCKRPADKTCKDGQLAWLNAPAESEGEDGLS